MRQCVATEFGCPDGDGPLPVGEHLGCLEKLPLDLNVAFLAGHGAIRRPVTMLADRAPTPAELAQMAAITAQAMREGVRLDFPSA